ncbi:peptidoglycan-binding protein [Celeribacter sp.]|uniref:peptidoglycan-binding protein n=1 Tax=Celeribacter sp. TaxID=1890673 RepID=UPI003A8D5761
MSYRVSVGFFAASLFASVLGSAAFAQNLLVDGGFDGAPQTQFGDRFDEDLPPWMFATVAPTNVILNTQNLVVVDGPGGHDYLDLGPESDASGAPAGETQYYIDSGNIPLYGWQYFTPSCSGTATARVMVTNREGHGVTGPTLTGADVPAQPAPFTFGSTQGGLALLQVQNQIPAFPVGFAVAPASTAQLVIDLKTQFDAEKMPFLLAAGTTRTYPWTPMTVQAPVTAGQLYAFMAELGHSVNMDNASVEVACDEPPTTPNLTPKIEHIKSSKVCEQPVQATVNGVLGYTWDCQAEITVTPTPFAGTYTLEDDASNISIGAAQFVSISEPNCSPLGLDHISCEMDGATMTAPHVVDYQLFTELTDPNEVIEWENCLDGHADTAAGTFPAIPMCMGRTIKPEIVVDPKEPPVIALKKGCRAMGEDNGTAYYLCSVYVSPPSSGTLTGPLTLDELFTTTSGASATQYIQSLIGTPAASNGWTCQQPAFPNGASCTISAADFNSNTGHRIDAQIVIPTAVLAKEGFTNCAQVRIGDQVVGTADCVDIAVETETTFDVDKSCKPSGDRMIFSEAFWVQPYQCTLTVTTAGAPFTGPLWVSEDLHFGQNPGASQILTMTSADPWDCSNPPYTAAGQGGNAPYCGIQGSQFPASGSSTITVDLLMNASMDLFGAENCVSLSVGEPDANGLPAPVAEDCFEIAPAPVSAPTEPSIDLAKSCSPAVLGADGIWTAQCEVTLTLNDYVYDPSAGNAPYIDLVDELVPNGVQTPLTSLMPLQTPDYGCCWGPFTGTPAGFNNARINPRKLADRGGSVTLDYTATFAGPGGRPVNGQNVMNCVSASSPALNLRVPEGPLGTERICVPIEFPLTAVVGPDVGSIADPGRPTPGTGGSNPGPVIDDDEGPLTATDSIFTEAANPSIPMTPLAGDSASCSLNTMFVIDNSYWMDAAHGNRLDITKTAIVRALDGLRGNGSAVAFNAGNTASGVHGTYRDIDAFYSSIVSNTLPTIQAGGQSSWQMAFGNMQQNATPPLVVFITAGPPSYSIIPNTYTYHQVPVADAIAATVPSIAALRASGSRVIGIGIGTDISAAHLTAALGGTVTNFAAGGAVNPLVNDVIMIPNAQDAPEAFAKIAATYCPTSPAPLSASDAVADLQVLTPTPVLPLPRPMLTIKKSQTSACLANRGTQTYDCGFRLSVTNTGTGPFVGPLVVTDTIGNPGATSATLRSGNGWSCAGPVGGAVTCDTSLLNLAAGATTHLDLTMGIKGLRKGGSFENCAAVGIPDNRTQRVAAIQQVMNARGLNAGPVDGKPGQKTYAALAKLQASLGLPVSREFDDALFQALGLPLQTPDGESCVSAQLPVMPAPPLQCDRATTVKQGESCACRYDDMERRNATSCQCGGGMRLVTGKGCVVEAVPVPEPVPAPKPAPDVTPLSCDPASTRLSGDQCVCLDQKNAKKVSDTQCRCSNGLPMIGGRCLPVVIKPSIGTGGDSGPVDDAAGTEKCKIMFNGVCLKK